MSDSKYYVMGNKTGRSLREEQWPLIAKTPVGMATLLVENHTVGFSIEKFNRDLEKIAQKVGLEAQMLLQSEETRLEILQEFHFQRGTRLA